jgi:hypothetical protein
VLPSHRVPVVALLMMSVVAPATADDLMVFTAHQDFLSRVYLMDADGTVERFFEYQFFFLADVEVVDGAVYIAEAFAPRVERIDLDTGELEVVVDDWSLLYFYGVAFDGTYLYVAEWDLNRYDLNGVNRGTASFDEDVMGMAWDGTHLWTLNDSNQIRCWDLSGWPTVTAVPDNDFVPPTPDCRGLWFDGEHFWTAESIDGSLGHIYRFDADGAIVEQWREPAFRGWGACRVPDPAHIFSDGFESGDLSAWGGPPEIGLGAGFREHGEADDSR